MITFFLIISNRTAPDSLASFFAGVVGWALGSWRRRAKLLSGGGCGSSVLMGCVKLASVWSVGEFKLLWDFCENSFPFKFQVLGNARFLSLLFSR